MPEEFVTRSLDEVRFWSRIMKEHSLFLRLGFRCEDTQLINEANQYYSTFESIENRANAFTVGADPQTIRRFNEEAYSSFLISTNCYFKQKIWNRCALNHKLHHFSISSLIRTGFPLNRCETLRRQRVI
jgi:Domain of unknown function (DUF2935)